MLRFLKDLFQDPAESCREGLEAGRAIGGGVRQAWADAMQRVGREAIERGFASASSYDSEGFSIDWRDCSAGEDETRKVLCRTAVALIDHRKRITGVLKDVREILKDGNGMERKTAEEIGDYSLDPSFDFLEAFRKESSDAA